MALRYPYGIKFVFNVRCNKGIRFKSRAILGCHSFIHSMVCLITGPSPLPKQVLLRVRSSASAFDFQYPLFSLTSSSICLRLLPRLPVTSILPSISPSITSSCLHRASVTVKHFIIQLMHSIQYVDTIKIIKYLKVFQHVSDQRRSIIGEPCTVLG